MQPIFSYGGAAVILILSGPLALTSCGPTGRTASGTEISGARSQDMFEDTAPVAQTHKRGVMVSPLSD
ncbi:MAG: hypothetical protein ABW192_06010 [Sphingobium sp.]